MFGWFKFYKNGAIQTGTPGGIFKSVYANKIYNR